MGLDLTNERHRLNHAWHWRRYLHPHGETVAVIRLQDYWYREYEPDRFLDDLAFETRSQALAAPLDLAALLNATEEPDPALHAQVYRNVRQILRTAPAQGIHVHLHGAELLPTANLFRG